MNKKPASHQWVIALALLGAFLVPTVWAQPKVLTIGFVDTLKIRQQQPGREDQTIRQESRQQFEQLGQQSSALRADMQTFEKETPDLTEVQRTMHKAALTARQTHLQKQYHAFYQVRPE